MESQIVELVNQARNRRLETAVRHAAFGLLVNRYQGMAYRVALTILNDGDQAQDAVQDAFVAAFQNLGQLRQANAFGAWLRQIVQSQAYRQIRSRQVPADSLEEESLPSGGLDPAAALETIEMKQRVMAAIDALPVDQQEVTRLFYMNGYSQKEIAGQLELPLTTVKKRLQYARQQLRGVLAAFWLPEPEPQPALVPVEVAPTPVHRPDEREW